jgi:Domain of unknown function (DUF4399)
MRPKAHTPMNIKSIQMCLAAVALSACGPKPSEPPAEPAAPAAEPAPAAPAAAPAPAAPPSVELPAIPEGAKISFIEPLDGAKVTGPLENGKVTVAVKMGAEGILVKPAGQIEAGSGHHHLLVDSEPEPEGTVVPKDETHIHFGQGQTEGSIALTPGEHTLRLQLADGIHRSYGPKLSAAIKINVAEGPAGTALAAKSSEKTKPDDHEHGAKHKH